MGLYQIDLQEEDRPDVVSIKIGWSRYCVVGASGGFLLGALVSVADFFRRQRLLRHQAQKRAEVNAKLLAASERARRQAQQQIVQQAQAQARGRQVNDQHHRPGGVFGPSAITSQSKWATAASTAIERRAPRRMASTVQRSMRRMMADRNGFTLADTVGSRCITVDERPKGNVDGNRANIVSNRNQYQSIRGNRTDQARGDRSRIIDNPDNDAMTEAAKKYKLTKSNHVDSIDERKAALPAVEEEKGISGNDRSVADTSRSLGNDGNNKNKYSNNSSFNGKDNTVRKASTNTISVNSQNIAHEFIKSNNRCSEEAKIVTTKELNHKQTNIAKEEKDNPRKSVKSDAKEKHENITVIEPPEAYEVQGRRVSTVEEALKGVRSMLASINDDLEINNSKTKVDIEPVVNPSKRVPSITSLNSSIDSSITAPPIKQRLPSIEESLTEEDKKRQQKRTEKLDSVGRDGSQESRFFTDNTNSTDVTDLNKKAGAIPSHSKQHQEQERSTTQQDKTLSFDSEKGVRAEFARNSKNENSSVDNNKSHSSERKESRDNGWDEGTDESKDARECTKKKENQLTQSLSEEQIKRNQIVQSIATARKDRKKKRITQ